MRDVRAAGYEIGNIDATIVVDRPKLASSIPAIRERLATALQVDVAAIGVKAKTSEGMGYTGDGSGIACYAVALLERS
jgi:2-C-methyl-D-erythritol 2,4-cyclodiphosphate synthase